jgi:hypothetical protein
MRKIATEIYIFGEAFIKADEAKKLFNYSFIKLDRLDKAGKVETYWLDKRLRLYKLRDLQENKRKEDLKKNKEANVAVEKPLDRDGSGRINY